MATSLNPYLNFRDSARAALEFYQSVFGGELTVSSFADFGMGPEMGISEDEKDKVMHGQIVAPNGFTLMAADVPLSMPLIEGSNISVSLSGTDSEPLTEYWNKISADAQAVAAPLAKAPWGDTFGMCTDKFGINWLVNIGAPQS